MPGEKTPDAKVCEVCWFNAERRQKDDPSKTRLQHYRDLIGEIVHKFEVLEP